MKKRTVYILASIAILILVLIVLCVRMFVHTGTSNQTSTIKEESTQSPVSTESNRATVDSGMINLKYVANVKSEVSNNKLHVTGFINNHSEVYHITDFSDLVIEISDKDGNHLLDVEINDVIGSNNIIPPGGWIEYNLSLQRSSVNNASQSTSLRYQMKGSYTYEVCDGEVCSVCNTKTMTKTTQNSTTKTTQNSTNVDSEPCRKCNQTGKCPDCGGSGKSKLDSIVAQAMGCTLCDRTGDCYKCNGKGWIPVY